MTISSFIVRIVSICIFFSAGTTLFARQCEEEKFYCAFGNTLTAPKYDKTDGWVPFVFMGQWGFKDGSGQVVIEPTLNYDFCWPFSEGLARVQVNGYYYFVNSTGSKIRNEAFDEANDFSHGVAAVMNYKKGKWYYIDQTGKFKFYEEYTMAHSFYDHKALVVKGESVYYIDETGKQLLGRSFSYAQQFQGDFAIVREEGSEHLHYINHNGEEAFPGLFHSAYPFEGGLAVVQDTLLHTYIIDKSGKKIRDLSYMVMSKFDRTYSTEFIFVDKIGVAYDTLEKNYFYIDWNFEKCSPRYKWAGSFSIDGIAAVQESDGSCHYIDRSFNSKFSNSFVGIYSFGDYSRFTIVRTQDSLWKLFTKEGEFIKGISSTYVPHFIAGFASIKMNNEAWLVNYMGEKVYGPYNWTGGFSYGCELAPVQDGDNRCYFIDRSGAKYGYYDEWDYIGKFSKGLAPVGKNYVSYYVDSEMGRPFNLTFQHANVFNYYGFAKVKMNDKWGLINSEGKIVVPCTYADEVDCPEVPPK